MAVAGVPTVRLFVSSPSDVMPERDRVDRVVRRLNAGLQNTVRIEAVRWENDFFTADAPFQAQIADTGSFEIVVSIFWQRLGTPISPAFERMPNGEPYPSGTVFEVMKALDARAKSEKGLPDVLVYRKLADVAVPLTNRDRHKLEFEQREAFLSFWEKWVFTSEGEFKAAYNEFKTTDEFETKLEQHLRSWLIEHGYGARDIAWPIAEKGSPFRGLEAFRPADEEIFFGRERDTARVLERLDRASLRGCSAILLVGESGSGKSSLARAGIVPKLLRGSLAGRIESWRYAEAGPGPGATDAIAEALFAADAVPELAHGDFHTPGALAGLMASSGRAAVAPILRALDRAGTGLQQKLSADVPVEVGLILVLDQFESLLGRGSDAEIENLAQALLELARSGRVVVIATLRSDAYSQFVRVPGLLALKEAGETFDVATPGPEGLVDIIRRPALIAGLEFGREPATGQSLDEIFIASAKGRDALPLLEFSLSRLYGQMLERLARRGISAAQAGRGDLVLAYEDYAAFGGLEGAIAEAAERAFAGASAQAQATLPRLLRALAQAVDAHAGGADAAPFRLTEAAWNEVAPDAMSEELCRALADARILVLGGGERAQRVRLAHEAVLRTWPRARGIMDAHGSFFRIRADVTAAHQRWRRHLAGQAGRGADALLLAPGVPLAEAEDIRRRFSGELPRDLVEFIDRSSARARRQTRRLMVASVVFGLTAVTAVGAAGAAWLKSKEAAANAARAQANEASARAAEASAVQNFHGAADQAEALVVTLGDKLKNDPGVTREALNTILREGQRQIDELAARDPSDHYVAQVRAKTIVSIARNLFDFGDIATAKKLLASCMQDVKSRPRENWDQMDRAVAGLCYETTAKFALAEGKIEAALSMAEGALDLAVENARTAGADWIEIRNLTASLITVGDILVRSGDLDKAQARYRQALDLWRGIASHHNDEATREELAVVLDRAGKIADLQGKYEEAIALYREDLAIGRALHDAAPLNTAHTEALSVAYAKMGQELVRTGRFQEAIDNYRPCMELRRQLVGQDSGNWYWKSLLAEAIQTLGDALVRSGKADEGRALLSEAIDQFRLVVQHDTKNQASRRQLAIALNVFAVSMIAKDKEGALRAAHESLELARDVAAADSSGLFDVVAALLTVADAGEETSKNYAEALSILQSLDKQGTLPPARKAMLISLKTYLEKLPKP